MNIFLETDVLMVFYFCIPGFTYCAVKRPISDILCRISKDTCQKNISDEDAIATITEMKLSYIPSSIWKYNAKQSAGAFHFDGHNYCRVINAAWWNNTRMNLLNEEEFEIRIQIGEYPWKDYVFFLQSPSSLKTNHLRWDNMYPLLSYKVSFVKTIINMLPPPYPSRCYNYDGIVGDVQSFSETTCRTICLAEDVLKLCGCIPLGYGFIDGYQACNKSISDKCRLTLTKNQMVEKCSSSCPVSCRAETYETFTILEGEKPLAFNVSVVWVNMRGNTCLYFSEDPQIETIEILGYVGGYLGIWLGLSFPLIADWCLKMLDRSTRRFETKPTVILVKTKAIENVMKLDSPFSSRNDVTVLKETKPYCKIVKPKRICLFTKRVNSLNNEI